MSKQQDQRQLRDALGQFATGITVITTHNSKGDPIGMTANSFTSVSLSPPLIAWSIALESSCYSVFNKAEYFTVNVLDSSQEHLSNLFASRGSDTTVFDDVAWSKGANGAPVLSDVKVFFECQLKTQYEGGDHTILIGEVVNYSHQAIDPLVFFGGKYKNLK